MYLISDKRIEAESPVRSKPPKEKNKNKKNKTRTQKNKKNNGGINNKK